jgi:phosphonate transport system substrate-binding protein
MTRFLLMLALTSLAGNALAAEGRGGKSREKKVSLTVKKLPGLRLGLSDYGGASEAAKASEAFKKKLGEAWGREVTTKVYADYDQLAGAVAKGEVDIAWLQPFAFVAAEKKGAVQPLVKAVRHGLPFYRGVLFARADKGISDVAGLAGKSIAWAEPTSSAGYLFPRAALIQSDNAPSKLGLVESFAGNHEAVCKAVVEGKADVGATFADDRGKGQAMQVDGCVQSIGADATKGLVILLKSAPIPNDTIAVRPGFDPEDAARLRKQFLELKEGAAGRELLEKVFKAEEFSEVVAEDFEPVRYAAEAAAKK